MSTGGPAEELKVLVFATENNPLAARISLALGCVGFDVTALTPPGHPARKARRIQRHFTHGARSRLKSVSRAIARSSPDLVVCTDDLAVRELQDLHKRNEVSCDITARRLCDLI